jgi:hypothetical protein
MTGNSSLILEPQNTFSQEATNSANNLLRVELASNSSAENISHNSTTSNKRLDLLFDLISNTTASPSQTSAPTFHLEIDSKSTDEASNESRSLTGYKEIKNFKVETTEPVAYLEQQLNVNTNHTHHDNENKVYANEDSHDLSSSASFNQDGADSTQTPNINTNSSGSQSSTSSTSTSSSAGTGDINMSNANHDNSDENIDLNLVKSVHVCAAQVRRFLKKIIFRR